MSAQRIPVLDLNTHQMLVDAAKGVVRSKDWLANAEMAEREGFPLAAEAFRATAQMAAKLEQEEQDAREFLRRLT